MDVRGRQVEKQSLRKIVDETDAIRSKTGSAAIGKEEVWVGEKN